MALPQSKYSAIVTWNPPPKSSWNGFIRKYKVKVECDSCDAPAKSSCIEKYVVKDKMEYPISNLSPGTEYSVQVSACTSAGPGKWSDPYKFTTHESGMFLISFYNISGLYRICVLGAPLACFICCSHYPRAQASRVM